MTNPCFSCQRCAHFSTRILLCTCYVCPRVMRMAAVVDANKSCYVFVHGFRYFWGGALDPVGVVPSPRSTLPQIPADHVSILDHPQLQVWELHVYTHRLPTSTANLSTYRMACTPSGQPAPLQMLCSTQYKTITLTLYVGGVLTQARDTIPCVLEDKC